MAGDETPSRINVSRDALRAELAEMELRLRIYFDDRLSHKAEASELVTLRLVVDKLERGEWNDAQRRSILAQVRDHIDTTSDRAWTRRDQFFTLLGVALASCSLFIYILVASHGGAF